MRTWAWCLSLLGLWLVSFYMFSSLIRLVQAAAISLLLSGVFLLAFPWVWQIYLSISSAGDRKLKLGISSSLLNHTAGMVFGILIQMQAMCWFKMTLIDWCKSHFGWWRGSINHNYGKKLYHGITIIDRIVNQLLKLKVRSWECGWSADWIVVGQVW